MSQVTLLRSLVGNPQNLSDEVLQFYLDNAKDIICEIRNSVSVETQYEKLQIKIAIELFSKRGAEGEISHTENGIQRMYASADVSPALIEQITPFAKTPYSLQRGAVTS